MKKQLVEAGNVDAFICQSAGKLYQDGTLVLTPGAKDELSRRKVAIECGPHPGCGGCSGAGCTRKAPAACCPPGTTCPACAPHAPCAGGADAERLMLAVAVVLRDEFGMKDLATLHATSARVAQAMAGKM